VFANLRVHHYNHTIVPAALTRYHDRMFGRLHIAKRFSSAIEDGTVDLVKITGEVSDCITGCSSKHTRKLREGIFKGFAGKIVEDNLFGNSEGVDLERWQGREIQNLIRNYMRSFRVDNYISLFAELDRNRRQRSQFIKNLLAIKTKQKREFIEALFSGIFGDIGLTREELAKAGIDFMERPFFAFVRRMVKYKCADLIVDMLYNSRERIIASKAVIFIGGREFDDFSAGQLNRIRELIKHDPRMKYHIIFIHNQNVFTSWLMQQGVDVGGMLSWEDKEAGPTGYCKAMVNGSPILASPDGVIPERVKPMNRDAHGTIKSGTGYIVKYGQERSKDEDIMPDRESLVQAFEEASKDYFDPYNHGQSAYNALKRGMLQGDIRNQAKGLLRVWADELVNKPIAASRLSVQDPQKERDRTDVATTVDLRHNFIFDTTPTAEPVKSWLDEHSAAVAEHLNKISRDERLRNLSINIKGNPHIGLRFTWASNLVGKVVNRVAIFQWSIVTRAPPLLAQLTLLEEILHYYLPGQDDLVHSVIDEYIVTNYLEPFHEAIQEAQQNGIYPLGNWLIIANERINSATVQQCLYELFRWMPQRELQNLAAEIPRLDGEEWDKLVDFICEDTVGAGIHIRANISASLRNQIKRLPVDQAGRIALRVISETTYMRCIRYPEWGILERRFPGWARAYLHALQMWPLIPLSRRHPASAVIALSRQALESINPDYALLTESDTIGLYSFLETLPDQFRNPGCSWRRELRRVEKVLKGYLEARPDRSARVALKALHSMLLEEHSNCSNHIPYSALLKRSGLVPCETSITGLMVRLQRVPLPYIAAGETGVTLVQPSWLWRSPASLRKRREEVAAAIDRHLLTGVDYLFELKRQRQEQEEVLVLAEQSFARSLRSLKRIVVSTTTDIAASLIVVFCETAIEVMKTVGAHGIYITRLNALLDKCVLRKANPASAHGLAYDVAIGPKLQARYTDFRPARVEVSFAQGKINIKVLKGDLTKDQEITLQHRLEVLLANPNWEITDGQSVHIEITPQAESLDIPDIGECRLLASFPDFTRKPRFHPIILETDEELAGIFSGDATHSFMPAQAAKFVSPGIIDEFGHARGLDQDNGDSATLEWLVENPDCLQVSIAVLDETNKNDIYPVGDWLAKLKAVQGWLIKIQAIRAGIIDKLVSQPQRLDGATVDNFRIYLKPLVGQDLAALEDALLNLAIYIFPKDDEKASNFAVHLTAKIIDLDCLYSEVTDRIRNPGTGESREPADAPHIDKARLHRAVEELRASDSHIVHPACEKIYAMGPAVIPYLQEHLARAQAKTRDAIETRKAGHISSVLRRLAVLSCLCVHLQQKMRREAALLLEKLDVSEAGLVYLSTYKQVAVHAKIANALGERVAAAIPLRQSGKEGDREVYHVDPAHPSTNLWAIKDSPHAWVGADSQTDVARTFPALTVSQEQELRDIRDRHKTRIALAVSSRPYYQEEQFKSARLLSEADYESVSERLKKAVAINAPAELEKDVETFQRKHKLVVFALNARNSGKDTIIIFPRTNPNPSEIENSLIHEASALAGYPHEFNTELEQKMFNFKVRAEYRYIGVSVGGDKVAISINDGNNNVLACSFCRWSQAFPDWTTKRRSTKKRDGDDVARFIVKEILWLIRRQGVDKVKIERVSVNLAGPVDEENGIFGSEFAAPNLPFKNYPFRDRLENLFLDREMIVEVVICNDAKGSLMGETYSPRGSLREFRDGGIVIIGGGINIAVKKDGEPYFGKDNEIREAGHNIIQIDNEHYAWVGDKTQGRHPLEKGNTRRAILRKCGGNPGEIGYEYLNDPAQFARQHSNYPVIAWGNGLRDFEDRLSGPNIRRRLKKAGLGYTERTLTPCAQQGDREAKQWINKIGREVGLALAAFIAAYQGENFVRHLVLVSGINENMGKAVYDNSRDRAQDLDIYIKSLREGARDELVNHFGMRLSKAIEITQGITRSRMTYERELVSYQPGEEEVSYSYKFTVDSSISTPQGKSIGEAYQRLYAFLKAIKKGKYQHGNVVDLRDAPKGIEIALIGDLHGRRDNLRRILNSRRTASEPTLLEKIQKRQVILLILGDAVHYEPTGKEGNAIQLQIKLSGMDDSVEIMQDIMELKIENPDYV
ncbi:MAG: ROK family protein, partial [Candidatus Omnitrophica bacterium]|nr:ROK family protein [Candidatus Omnitrophota bacterium]